MTCTVKNFKITWENRLEEVKFVREGVNSFVTTQYIQKNRLEEGKFVREGANSFVTTLYIQKFKPLRDSRVHGKQATDTAAWAACIKLQHPPKAENDLEWWTYKILETLKHMFSCTGNILVECEKSNRNCAIKSWWKNRF